MRRKLAITCVVLAVTGRVAGRCLLQQARDVRAVDQGRQERHQVDAAVMLLVRRQRRAASASCAGLQSRQLHADAAFNPTAAVLIASNRSMTPWLRGTAWAQYASNKDTKRSNVSVI
jgi:hypothetical protein